MVRENRGERRECRRRGRPLWSDVMQTWSEMITYQAGRRPDNTFLADVLGKVRKGLLRDRTWASAGLPT